MKTLIEAVELWIDSKVESNLRPWLKDMEDIHIRDANRIAELERRVLELSAYDTFSPDADAGESMHEADQMLSELASRLEDVESILEDKIDTSDVEEMIEVAINDIDIESHIFDAVRSEIDAIEFKVTVER
jgi:hypothetical protein